MLAATGSPAIAQGAWKVGLAPAALRQAIYGASEAALEASWRKGLTLFQNTENGEWEQHIAYLTAPKCQPNKLTLECRAQAGLLMVILVLLGMPVDEAAAVAVNAMIDNPACCPTTTKPEPFKCENSSSCPNSSICVAGQCLDEKQFAQSACKGKGCGSSQIAFVNANGGVDSKTVSCGSCLAPMTCVGGVCTCPQNTGGTAQLGGDCGGPCAKPCPTGSDCMLTSNGFVCVPMVNGKKHCCIHKGGGSSDNDPIGCVKDKPGNSYIC